MTDPTKPAEKASSRAQELVYQERAEAYDELIAREDVDGAILRAIEAHVLLDDKRIADVGAGTGRLSRLIGARAAHIDLIDRAEPMLEVAKARLQGLGLRSHAIHVADARALPLADESADLAMAGWVFGHFRHWMPEGWRLEVDTALREMKRIVKPGGAILLIESLGTGYETPREANPLDEYFAHLEAHHGFTRSWFRTDYAFESEEHAARVCEGFFGAALVEKIRAHGWSRVPECTALFFLRC